jgi:endonuclease/exonuclease/phosphatase family metal-dependent hydrolase
MAGVKRKPEDPGFTWDNRNPYAASVHEPDRRIDYIFVGYPVPGGVGRVERCRVVCDKPEGEIWPSDHLGVFAEIRTP